MPISSIGLFDAVLPPNSETNSVCTALKAVLMAEAAGSAAYDVYAASSEQEIGNAVLKQTGFLTGTGLLAALVCRPPVGGPGDEPMGKPVHRQPPGFGFRQQTNPLPSLPPQEVLENDPLATTDEVCAPKGQYQRPVRIEQPLPEPWGLDTLVTTLLVIGAVALVCVQPEVTPFLAPAL